MDKNRTSVSASFDGLYFEDAIDGYLTMGVSGRESLETSVASSSIDIADGGVYKYRKYGSRTLTISFAIVSDSYTDLLSKFEDLNGLLTGHEMKIIFDDEPDKYYIGTQTGSPEYSRARLSPYNLASGTFEIFCADPFKYSVDYETLTIGSSSLTDHKMVFTTENEGYYKSYPEIKVHFPVSESSGDIGEDSDCGYILFGINDDSGVDRSIQFGDDEEMDTGVTQINHDLTSIIMASNGWKNDYDTKVDFPTGRSYYRPSNATTLASSSIAQTNGLAINSYGTKSAAKAYSEQRGCLATKTLDEAEDSAFNFEWVQTLAVNATTATGKAQCFSFYALLHDSDGNIAFGVGLDKLTVSSTYANLWLYDPINSKWDLWNGSYNVAYTGNLGYSDSPTTTKTKKKVGKKYKYVTTTTHHYTARLKTCSFVRSYDSDNKVWNTVITFPGMDAKTIQQEEAKSIASVSFWFGRPTYNPSTTKNKNADAADRSGPTINSVRSVKFSSGSNTFGSNDYLFIDTSKMTVKKGQSDNEDAATSSPELGDISNDWDEFVIEPGDNSIYCQWSDWCSITPEVEIKYRKRYI